MAYFDIDTSVRINGGLTVNGDTTIPSSFNLYIGGGNLTVTGNITSTSNISGNHIGAGSSLTVNGTTANGGVNPISNGWAYTHENKTGSLGHIPSGGSTTTYLRGDNTWVTPADTDTYATGLSSTSGGNGTLTVTRNTGSNLTVNLAHTHPFSQLNALPTTLSGYGITDGAPKAIPNSGAYPTFLTTGYFPIPLFGDKLRWRKPILVEYFDGSVWQTWSTTSFDILTDARGDTTASVDYTHKKFRVTYSVDAWSQASLAWFCSSYNAPTGNVTIETTKDSWVTTNIRANAIPCLGSYWRYTSVSDYADDNTVRFTFDWGLTSGNSFSVNQLMYMTSRPAEQGSSMESLFPYSWDINKNISGISTLTATNFIGSGNSLTVSGTPVNGSVNPINAGWAYTHQNSTGLGSHVPIGGTATTYLRGDMTWVAPTDTDTYVTGLSSTSGGNGILTVTRNTGSNLTLDLTHNHDTSYYTKSQIDTQMSGKDYYGKWNLLAGATTIGVTASSNVTITGNGATTVSLVGNTLTISSTDNNTWRGIDTSPVSGDTSNSIASSWAYTHQNTYGLGSHVPTGGSTTTFLRGDGTWIVPTDTYVSGLSSTAGGNGTLTVSRNSGSNLTLNLAHNHDTSYLGISGTAVNANLLDNIDSTQFLRSDQNDTMGGILTISGTGATPLVLQRNGTTNVNLQFTHNSSSGFLGIDGTGQLKFGSVADLNASGYTVWHSNNFSPTSKVDNTTFSTHTGNTGVGAHIPTGGSTSQYLSGDGTWQTLSIIDTYVTGISSTSGGNGTLTVSQNQGQANLTLDLTHNHDGRYLGSSATASNSTLFNNLSSNQFVRSDSTTTMGVGLLFNATASGGILSSTPTALSYGQLQAYGTLNILADTDGSHTEFIYLSAGYPSGGANNGLKIGYNLADLTWKGYAIWHSGNMGSGSNLDADKLDSHDSSYFAYVGQNNLFKNMSGGVHYDSGVDMNTLQTVGEYRFINIASSGSANMPSGSSGMGYYFGMGGGDVGSRGFQLLGTSAKELYFKELSTNVWGRLWSDQNMGASSGLNADMVDSIQGSQIVRNDLANQTVNTGFTMSANAYVGMSNSSGALYVRTGSGSLGIQLAGDNSTKQSGVGAYLASNGTATFSGTMTANAIAVTSTALVSNLNAQMLNGIKEPQITKNQSIVELGGKGVYTGLAVSAQSVPNMTVQIATGTVYTDSGMRIVVPSSTNISFSAPSATYNRIDSVYVQGSSVGTNEGVITVLAGTAQASPVAPTIPSDGVLLANVTIRQNAGSILATDVADARVYKSIFTSNQNTYVTNTLYLQGNLDSTDPTITVNKPLQLNNSATNLKIVLGSTSVTWTHNLNLSKYAVTFSCDNAEPHVYWSNKTVNAITFNLDDVCIADVNIDVILVALQ